MYIGEIAQASGISAKMIRYYEESGLMPEVRRSGAGYRIYGKNDLHRLHFIRRARELGFSLAEISELLDLWDDQSRHSADVKRLAQRHIEELEQRSQSLRQMTDTLKTLIHCCAGDDRPECPILEGLQRPEGTNDESLPS